MKRLYYAIICLSIFSLHSCFKKSTNAPASSAVTINGRDYKTVKIGTRIWTSENYDGLGGIAVPAVDESLFGKLYSWPEAQGVTLPAGWRIPTQADFEDLLSSQGTITPDGVGGMFLDTVAAKRLKSQSNWTISGNNASGFNAEPAGHYNYYGSLFEDTYAYAKFWGSTFTTHGLNPTTQITLNIIGYFGSGGINRPVAVAASTVAFTAGGELSYSLRFVKDK